jgi:hypothetical protein
MIEFADEILDQNCNEFYFDVFQELFAYGEINDFSIAENLSNYLAGNILVRYQDPESACTAYSDLTGGLYAGRPIGASFTVVSDLQNAVCQDSRIGSCRLDMYVTMFTQNFLLLK